MRGIVMAGGTGSRLHPLTLALNKHLLPVYDKPMIYYPLATLMLAGVREIMMIVRTADRDAYERLLGDGSQWGISLQYAIQDQSRGIAEALIIGADFVGDQPFSLILGDNLFHGAHLGESLGNRFSDQRATVFSYEVRDASQYACVTVDSSGIPIDLTEKPFQPRSRLAVPGLYFYPASAVAIARSLRPSERGELEITDVNRHFLHAGLLDIVPLPRGTSWMDAGSPDALLDASNFVRILQDRQGLLIGLPSEVAQHYGWVLNGSDS